MSLGSSNQSFESRQSQLQMELSSLKEENKRLHNEIESKSSSDRLNESLLNGLRSQIKELEDSLSKSSDEIDKGNEIIKKLQTELKSTKSNLKVQSQLSEQHEKIQSDLQKSFEMLRTELENAKAEIRSRDLRILNLEKEKREIEDKMKDLERVNASNEKVMEWLHKQVNESSIQKVETQTKSNGIAPEANGPFGVFRKKEIKGVHGVPMVFAFLKSRNLLERNRKLHHVDPLKRCLNKRILFIVTRQLFMKGFRYVAFHIMAL